MTVNMSWALYPRPIGRGFAALRMVPTLLRGRAFQQGGRMPFRSLALLLAVCCCEARYASAQLAPPQSDALSKLQAAQNSAGCSPTEASSCAQVAGKLMPIILGDSPMIENLRRLTDGVGGRVTGTPQMAKAVEWGVAAFRAAGIDVHTEKYMLPVAWSEGETRLEILGPVKFPVRLVSTGWSPA